MKRTDVIKKLREMRIDEKKIGKLSWKFLPDHLRMDALLSTIKDPDEAQQYVDSEWDDLPPEVTQNMRLEGASITMGGTRVTEGGKDTIGMDRLKEIIKEEVINETRNLDKMQSKLRTVDNAQDVLRTLRDIISDTNTFNGQQFTKLEDIYEEIRDLKNDSGMNIGDLVSPAILDAFRKDMAEVPTVLSMLKDLEGDRVSKYAEFGE